jgi:CIC family chloride channel protein
MIAAATGVSVIALDEEIYCRSNSNKVLIIIIIFYILLGLFTGFISVYYSVIPESGTIFLV